MEENTNNIDKRGQIMRRSKQNSIMQILNNPFELAAQTKTQIFMKDTIPADAVIIIDNDFKTIILGALNIISDNEEKIVVLDSLKQPYLFTSNQLMLLCNIVTSLKTKIAFIKSLGPRIVDPNSMVSKFLDIFRFSEDKLTVERVLKDRHNLLVQSQFQVNNHTSNLSITTSTTNLTLCNTTNSNSSIHSPKSTTTGSVLLSNRKPTKQRRKSIEPSSSSSITDITTTSSANDLHATEESMVPPSNIDIINKQNNMNNSIDNHPMIETTTVSNTMLTMNDVDIIDTNPIDIHIIEYINDINPNFCTNSVSLKWADNNYISTETHY